LSIFVGSTIIQHMDDNQIFRHTHTQHTHR